MRTEHRKAYEKKYREEHRVEHSAYIKARRAAGKIKPQTESRKSYVKDYQKKNAVPIAARKKRWIESNPGIRRKWQLKHLYGMTEAEYLQRVDSQQGRCEICGTESKSLCVDHDHAVNDRTKVRGLICTACNKSLGFAKDNPTILQCMIAYLNRHRI